MGVPQHIAAKCAEIDAREDFTRNQKIFAKRAAGLTLKVIGDQYGLTRERVRQIVENIKRKDLDRGLKNAMAKTPINDSTHWRKKAKEARIDADQMVDPQSKQAMVSIAEEYERVAERAAQPPLRTQGGGGKERHEDNQVGERLKRLRMALGFEGHGGQKSFAKYLGVEGGRFNKVEKGGSLGKELAFRIVANVPEVTLEWLWWGERRCLTIRFLQMLDSVK